MKNTNDWSREAHRAGRIHAPGFTSNLITAQTTAPRPNKRANLPALISHQIEREQSANAALAPMAQLPAIRAMRAIKELLTR